MKDNHSNVSIEKLCGLFGYSRVAWYKKQKRVYKAAVEEHIILEKIRKIRKKMPRLGVRKLHHKVKEEGFEIGRDKLFDILRRNGLLVRKRKNWTRTTESFHWLRKYPNLIKTMALRRPNQLWVSDITYIETADGFLYLFLLTDAYSKRIMGYKTSDDLIADNAIQALKMALNTLSKKPEKLTHHSDRGVQYCCNDYVKLLKKFRVDISMTEQSDPLENAIAERVNGILKDEWLTDQKAIDKEAMKLFIPRIIKIYNEDRPHLSLDMYTPNKAHKMTGPIKRRWKNYYKEKNNADKKETSEALQEL